MHKVKSKKNKNKFSVSEFLMTWIGLKPQILQLYPWNVPWATQASDPESHAQTASPMIFDKLHHSVLHRDWLIKNKTGLKYD